MKHLFSVVLLLVITFTLQAQEFRGLDKSPLDMAKFPVSNSETNKLVRIIYSRPQLKGRSVAKLAPNGKVWRTEVP